MPFVLSALMSHNVSLSYLLLLEEMSHPLKGQSSIFFLLTLPDFQSPVWLWTLVPGSPLDSCSLLDSLSFPDFLDLPSCLGRPDSPAEITVLSKESMCRTCLYFIRTCNIQRDYVMRVSIAAGGIFVRGDSIAYPVQFMP